MMSHYCMPALFGVALLTFAWPAVAAEGTAVEPIRFETYVPMRAITSGPNAHWFGYYDKLQFCPSDRYVLAMEVSFEDRAPGPDDAVALGMIDTENSDAWIPIAESTAWCWQQGCMLQWLPGSQNEVIYNARQDGRYVSVIRDVFTGAARTLPRPIYSISGDGKWAVGLNFARLGETRPGYGYNGILDPEAADPHPKDDGIYVMDLATGESRLTYTLDQIVSVRHNESMDAGKSWFNHLLVDQDGSRFIFLHRWYKADGKGWHTRMFTGQPDGRNLHCLADHGMVSHFIWRNPKQVLAWSREPEPGDRFHLYDDATENVAVIGDGVLITDGHCTYSPDGEWILTDTYPDRERMQSLMLYRPSDGKLVKLGRFHQEQPSDIQLRCDLHPRWSRDGRYVCIDSKHSGKRQVYLLDVSEAMRVD